MASSDQEQISECWHVGIVVKDVEKVVDFYSRAFGWGPWKRFTSDFPNAVMRGKTTWYKGKRAYVQVGGVGLEVGEPGEGDSVQKEFLSTKGEGLHHLAFYVDDIEKEVAKLEKMGLKILQAAKNEDGSYAYVYLDTEEVGNIIVELNRRDTLSSLNYDM